MVLHCTVSRKGTNFWDYVRSVRIKCSLIWLSYVLFPEENSLEFHPPYLVLFFLFWLSLIVAFLRVLGPRHHRIQGQITCQTATGQVVRTDRRKAFV